MTSAGVTLLLVLKYQITTGEHLNMQLLKAEGYRIQTDVGFSHDIFCHCNVYVCQHGVNRP